MPRRANYGFQKRQKEIKRQQKKDEKAAKRQTKRDKDKDRESSDVTPTDNDLASDPNARGGD